MSAASEINWPHVFDAAFRWPELRIWRWRDARPNGRLSLKAMLRHAAKEVRAFHLSRDLVWAVTRLSLEVDPVILAEALIATRWPFQTTLISWDPLDRDAVYDNLGVAHQSAGDDIDIPACVITTAPDARVFLDVSYLVEKKRLNVYPILFRASADPIRHGTRSFFDDTDVFAGNAPVFSHWWLSSDIARKNPESARQIYEDKRIDFYPFGPIADSLYRATHISKLEFAKTIVSSTSGGPRWLGALAYLLNAPKIIRYTDTYQAPEPLGKPRKESASGKPIELTLFLPKEKVVTQVLRNIERKERKPVGEHDVISHWAVAHKRGDDSCEHVWPIDDTRRQLCLKCGTLRWRKPPSKRGKGDTLKARRRIMDYSGQPVEKLLGDAPKELDTKEKAKGRSPGYWGMSAADQWAEDKRLGILDCGGD